MERRNIRDAVVAKLDELAIGYTLLEHSPIMTMEEGEAIAGALGIEPCKNLFLANRQGEHFLLLLSGDKKLNAKAVAQQIGSSRLSFASADELREMLSVEQGAVSVLALMFDRDKRVRLLIDKDVANQEYIGCHPCVNTCSLKLRTRDVLDIFLPAVGYSRYSVIEI